MPATSSRRDKFSGASSRFWKARLRRERRIRPVPDCAGGVCNMWRDDRAEDVLRRAMAVCEAAGTNRCNCDHNARSRTSAFLPKRSWRLPGRRSVLQAISRQPDANRRRGRQRRPRPAAEQPGQHLYHSLGDDARALGMHYQALRAEGAIARSIPPLCSADRRQYRHHQHQAAGDLPTAIAFRRRADAILENSSRSTWPPDPSGRSCPFVRAASERDRPDDLAPSSRSARRPRRRRAGGARRVAAQGSRARRDDRPAGRRTPAGQGYARTSRCSINSTPRPPSWRGSR